MFKQKPPEWSDDPRVHAQQRATYAQQLAEKSGPTAPFAVVHATLALFYQREADRLEAVQS